MRRKQTYDIYGRTESSTLYLAAPGKRIICAVNGIDTSSALLTLNTNNTYTISFSVNKYINENEKSNAYDNIEEAMELYCDGIWFKIVDPPSITTDGMKEVKTVTAESYEVILSQYALMNFEINTGNEASYEMQYKRNYDLNDTENNPTKDTTYSSSKFFQVKFYNPEIPELSLLDLVLEHSGAKDLGWHIEYVDDVTPDDSDLDKSEWTFLPDYVTNYTVDNKSVYTFLTQEVSSACKCIFEFDTETLGIYVYRPATLGKDTNIILSFRNIQNNVDISRDDSLITQFYVSGLDDYNIDAVNLGTSLITDISYFMKEPYMNQDLINKYSAYIEYREKFRTEYKNLAKYRAILVNKMTELQNRVPTDSVSTDWFSCSMNDLQSAYTANVAIIAGLEAIYVDETDNFDIARLKSSQDDWNLYESIKNYTIPEISAAIQYKIANGAATAEESQFIPTGSGNLLKNPNPVVMNTDWYIVGKNTVCESKKYVTDEVMNVYGITQMVNVTNPTEASEFGGILQKQISVVPNKEYTLSCYIRRNSGEMSSNGRFRFEWGEVEKDRTYKQIEDVHLHVFDRFEATFTPTTSLINVAFTSSYTDIDICGMQLELGDSATSFGLYIQTSDVINGYETDWDLYGIDELKTKIKTYQGCADTLKEQGFDGSYSSDLDCKEDYFSQMKSMYNSYLTLLSEATNALAERQAEYDNYNSSTTVIIDKTDDDGNVILDDAGDPIQIEVPSVSNISTYQSKYIEFTELENWGIKSCISLSDVSIVGTEFTQEELQVIKLLYRQAEYTNDNIITTSLTTPESSIKQQELLYKDALDELYVESHPQYTYSDTIENIYALPELKQYHDELNVNDYIYLSLSDDGNIVKLRTISLSYNPFDLDQNMTITFSNMINYKSGTNDYDKLLNSVLNNSNFDGGSIQGTSKTSDASTYVLSSDVIQQLFSNPLFTSKVSGITTKASTVDSAAINELKIMTADIEDLQTENITVNEKITATESNFTSLSADVSNFKESTIEDLKATNANITDLQAKDAEIENLVAQKATIEDLKATNANITDLQAKDAEIENLVAQKATIEDLKATNANIENLQTEKLSASDAEIKYANIDFANIGMAAVEKLFTESGIIKDLVVGDTTITGELVGVTISGDLIKGNTIVAEKLVIKGEDGLYYKLNTNGETVESKQTDYNSINGSSIQAQSITASKIAVDDLVAFGATIGGFNIDTDKLYSGAKSSVDNTTRGIYLDNEGQIAFGDGTNYIKYFKDTDGKYKIKMKASEFTLASGSTIEEEIEKVKNESVSDVDVEYYSSTSATTAPSKNDTKWSTDAPTWEDGKYIWSRTKTTTQDGTVSYSDAVCITGNTGSQGDKGSDGTSVTITTKTVQYQASTSGTTTPTGTWSNTVPTVAKGQFLWTKTYVKYSDGNETTSYSVSYMGTNGSDGKDFNWNLLENTDIDENGVGYWTKNTSDSTIEVDGTYTDGSKTLKVAGGEGIYCSSWINLERDTTYTYSMMLKSSDKITVDNMLLHMWVSESKTTGHLETVIAFGGDASADTWTKAWITFKTPNEQDTYYMRPILYKLGTATWYMCKPKLEKGDKATDWSPAQADLYGKSIGSVVNYYLATSASSGVTTSTSGWTTTVQSITETNKYLWNYEIIKYTDGTTASTSTPCIIGTYGTKGDTGKGIKSITEHYQVSTSATTAPTTWSDTVPTMTETNKYLWNYETITYSDNSTSDTTKRVIGVYGNTGTSVSSIVEQYYLSTSNTTQTGGSWSDTHPTWKSGTYIWTRSHITFSNGNTKDTTPVLANGLNTALSTANTASSNASSALDKVNSVEKRVSTAEQKITDDAIVSTVTTSTTYTDALGKLTKKDEIISTINQTSESVTIDAKKINLKGAVTADSIVTGAVTTDKLSASAVTAEKIAAGAITADKIKAGEITADKIKAGYGNVKTYSIRGANNVAEWIKLGRLTSGNDASNFVINLYVGNGYNGRSDQNSNAKIIIKDRWQKTESANEAFGVDVTRQNCENLSVIVDATSSTVCDVWVYLPWAYWNGDYTISGNYSSWTHSGSHQTSEPTITGASQSVAYRMNAENAYSTATAAAKTATNYMSFDSESGLIVGDQANISSGGNVQITSSGMNVRKGGTTLASYGESIQLGNNGASVTLGQVADGKINTQLTSSGLAVRRDTTEIAKFGADEITLGNTSAYNTQITSSSINIRRGTENAVSFSLNTVDSNTLEILAGNGNALTISEDTASFACTDYLTSLTALNFFQKYAQSTLWGISQSYMAQLDSVTLSQAVSKQLNGIVLVFSPINISTNTPNDFGYICKYVPKWYVANKSGKAIQFELTHSKFSKMSTKYLYISDTIITGHADNTLSGTNNGITYNNKNFLLRAVVGV